MSNNKKTSPPVSRRRHVLSRALVVLLCLVMTPVLAETDVTGDGIDDIMTATTGTNFYTVSDKTIFVMTRHNGPLSGGSACNRDHIVGQANTVVALGAESSPDVWAAKNFDGTTDCAVGTFSGLNTWVTLVYRHTAGNVELYINGILAQATATGNSTSVASNVVLLWDGSIADGQYPGTIAQVVLYNVGISANQIAAYGQSFVRGRYPAGATAVWDFERCVHGASVDTQVFQDFSGNNRTITADNGANNTGMSCAGSSRAVKMPGVY